MTNFIVAELCFSNCFPCSCATLPSRSNQHHPRQHPCRWDTGLLSTLYCKQTGNKSVLANMCLCVQVLTMKRWSFTVNWKMIAFSSHWRTTQRHVTCSTCERFSHSLSKKGEQAELQKKYMYIFHIQTDIGGTAGFAAGYSALCTTGIGSFC